jgi:hypothetical protein
VVLDGLCACGRGGPASAAPADAPAELAVPGRPGDLSEETFAALERRTAALAELKARSVRFELLWRSQPVQACAQSCRARGVARGGCVVECGAWVCMQ